MSATAAALRIGAEDCHRPGAQVLPYGTLAPTLVWKGAVPLPDSGSDAAPQRRKGGAELVHSVCPHDCPSTCALLVERKDERTIGRVYGDPDNDYTAGVVCAKVARYTERAHNPDRLKTPLRHVKKYSGQHSTICNTLARSGYLAGTGALWGSDPREMAESDLVVIWGTNVVSTQVNVMHHVTRARKERGAKLVVVDPYRNATAEAADMHVMLRPGTDAAFACGVMHALFQEAFPHPPYPPRYTDVPDEIDQHVRS